MITDECSRCDTKKSDDVFRTSYFNTDFICSECQEIEEAHPDFEKAKKIESQHVLDGNYNFVGIGLPKDWREHVEKERFKRVSEGDS